MLRLCMFRVLLLSEAFNLYCIMLFAFMVLVAEYSQCVDACSALPHHVGFG